MSLHDGMGPIWKRNGGCVFCEGTGSSDGIALEDAWRSRWWRQRGRSEGKLCESATILPLSPSPSLFHVGDEGEKQEGRRPADSPSRRRRQSGPNPKRSAAQARTRRSPAPTRAQARSRVRICSLLLEGRARRRVEVAPRLRRAREHVETSISSHLIPSDLILSYSMFPVLGSWRPFRSRSPTSRAERTGASPSESGAGATLDDAAARRRGRVCLLACRMPEVAFRWTCRRLELDRHRLLGGERIGGLVERSFEARDKSRDDLVGESRASCRWPFGAPGGGASDLNGRVPVMHV